VAQLAKARRYTPEGRAFSSRYVHWDFLLTILPAMGLTQLITEISNWGVKAASA